MTIFLTTQYLDEADALADRVGSSTAAASWPRARPEELKRSIGQDLIVADVDGEDATVRPGCGALHGVDAVSYEEGRIVVSTKDGPAGLSPVAIALGRRRSGSKP